MFPTNTYIQTLHIIISHVCTEQLGKKLQQYNRATLLELIQCAYNNNNGSSVDMGDGICV